MKRDLERLSEREHDVLVVGGGIHGAAVARDAAQRGLGVALVEAHDFGSGASWNSLKTIHGGFRHLQRADVRGVRESSHERRALMTIAPELVRPLAFLVPAYGHGPLGREALTVALLAFDALTTDCNEGLPPERWLPRSRMLSPEEVRERLPRVPERGLSGGALWYDAQVESTERLLMGFLRAASADGAQLANYVEVTALLRDGGRVCGALARDVETGERLQVRARTVVAAAGAASAQLARMAGVERRPPRFVEGMNLVLNCAVVREMAVGARGGGRFLFVVPWRDRSIVGTDYWNPQRPPAGSQGLQARVDAFIDVAREAFPWAALGTDDVALVHRGRVPGRSASDLVTRHRVVDHARDGAPGLVSVLSAKYTTARAAAEEAVDAVVARLGIGTPPCRTAVTPLPFARALEGSLTERARTAAREEMALHLADAVLRRLDVGTGGPPAAAEVVAVASAMGEELGWSEERLREELEVLRTGLPWPSSA